VWLKTARPRRWCVIGRTKVVATAKKISLTMRSRSEVIKGALAPDETLVSRRRTGSCFRFSYARSH